ncbi:MAG: DUF1993 domain-containing protein [Proteobacteria bacterium]|nr:DUF1993 domain-containing protein [Pseudomonadota bacterium]
MSLSLYDASIPALDLGLTNLEAILDKAAAHAEAKKLDARVLPDARLIADMFPLKRQVQIACDTAKGAAARLAGVDIPKHEDTESTIAELKERIAKTRAFLASVTPEQVNGSTAREIVLQFPRQTLRFSAHDYALRFVLPNFYFHVTTAYAVLRKNGIDVGKNDYLGKIQ